MTIGRILHVSDIHFGAENRPAVDAVLACAHSETFDLVAVTGDITQFGRPDEFRAAADWIRKLPGPCLVTPGNHDVPYATPGRLFSPFTRFERALGPAWTEFWRDDRLAVRSFNTARGVQFRLNWSKGVARLGDAQVVGRYLADSTPGAFKLVLCHHPLVEVTGGPMTGRVRGGKAAAAVLAAHGAEAVLTGHVHTAFAHEMAGFGLYAIGAGTLSLRERGQPAGFNIVEWDEGCIRVRAQGWTGSHFETIRTWALERRIRP